MDFKINKIKWDETRLNVLIRDNRICVICRGSKKPLHAHHLYDKKKLEDYYNINHIVTLCPGCHLQFSEPDHTKIRRLLIEFWNEKEFDKREQRRERLNNEIKERKRKWYKERKGYLDAIERNKIKIEEEFVK
ncbi:hypothetical protein K8R33_04995 [archaeon]|nr:hypothetical protein [archaeon]